MPIESTACGWCFVAGMRPGRGQSAGKIALLAAFVWPAFFGAKLPSQRIEDPMGHWVQAARNWGVGALPRTGLRAQGGLEAMLSL